MQTILRKIRQINSGAYGKVIVRVDDLGRFRWSSAGLDILWHLSLLHTKCVEYWKYHDND